MEVLIVGLGCAVTFGIGESEAPHCRGVISEVESGREDGGGDEVVLVQTTTEKDRKAVVLPLILEVGTIDVGYLLGVDVVADGGVVEVVVAELRTCGQLGGHKEELVELVDILHTRRGHQVVGATIGIGVIVCTIVAAALGVLEGTVDVDAVVVLIIVNPLIYRSATIIYSVYSTVKHYLMFRFIWVKPTFN